MKDDFKIVGSKIWVFKHLEIEEMPLPSKDIPLPMDSGPKPPQA